MPAVVPVDYYDILGLPRSASIDDIKSTYRRLALKYHPQKSSNEESQGRFHYISEAYDILADPKRKAVYDLYGSEGLRNGVETTDPSDCFAGLYEFPAQKSLDIFQQFFGTDNVHEAVFSNGPETHVQVQDYHLIKQVEENPAVDVTLEELYCGALKKAEFKRNIFGAEKQIARTETKEFEIKIKPGWQTGTKIIFSKEGHQLANGFLSDAVFEVKTIPHGDFKRAGNDLHITRVISLCSSLTMTKLAIKTLDGRILNLLIADVISPAFIKMVPNEGMPISGDRSGKKGDLYIHFSVEFPEYLDETQRKLISQALTN